jgi:hypothetical protein
MDASATIRPENEGKAVKEMLSLELIGIVGLLFALLVWGMVVTQRDRRGVAVSPREIEAQKGVREVQ